MGCIRLGWWLPLSLVRFCEQLAHFPGSARCYGASVRTCEHEGGSRRSPAAVGGAEERECGRGGPAAGKCSKELGRCFENGTAAGATLLRQLFFLSIHMHTHQYALECSRCPFSSHLYSLEYERCPRSIESVRHFLISVIFRIVSILGHSHQRSLDCFKYPPPFSIEYLKHPRPFHHLL